MTRLRRPPSLLQLKIELAGIKPVIWRRIVVPSSITLGKLHLVIQAAMGWWGGHLHEFEIAGELYGQPGPDDPRGESVISEARVRLGARLAGTKSFRYLYDFGDGWNHRIKVERALPPLGEFPFALCVAGANACPPEDVGGAPGYADFVEAITQPNHPDHREFLDCYGGPFDPAKFDYEPACRRLDEIKL